MSSWVTLALFSMLTTAYCQFPNFTNLFTTRKPQIYYPLSSTTVAPKPEGVGCGRRQVYGPYKRISGVTDSFFGELPWVVAIFKYSELEHTYKYCCVGSLIHPRVVLSVKHYFKTPARIRIRAGDWDIAGDYEIHFHQSSDVTRVRSHPKYTERTHAYDAALLELSTSINLAPNVDFACLPSPGLVTTSGTRCIVAGWGQETFTDDTIRDIMKMTEVPAVDLSVCRTQLSDYKNRTVDVPDSMLCAGGEKDKDACLKDGGAPLVCPYPDKAGRYYQAGIVSWGIGCGLPNVPGVYTSVPKIREWIDEKFREMNYEITYLP